MKRRVMLHLSSAALVAAGLLATGATPAAAAVQQPSQESVSIDRCPPGMAHMMQAPGMAHMMQAPGMMRMMQACNMDGM